MRLIRYLPAYVFALLLLPFVGNAQPDPSESSPTATPPPQESHPLNMRFATFLPANANYRFLLANEEWLSQPFTIPSNSFSKSQGVPTRTFTLAVQQNGSAPLPLETVTLPEEGHSFLILLLPGSTENARPRLAVIRADDPAFKAGDVQFFNLSDAPVAVRMVEQTILLKPQDHQKISPPTLPNDIHSYQVEFYTQDQERTYLFGATQWLNHRRARTYLFTYKSPQTGRMNYRAIDEFPSWMRN